MKNNGKPECLSNFTKLEDITKWGKLGFVSHQICKDTEKDISA